MAKRPHDIHTILSALSVLAEDATAQFLVSDRIEGEFTKAWAHLADMLADAVELILDEWEMEA